MGNNGKTYWRKSLELIMGNSRIVVPFVMVAFFEALALVLIYFSPRKPLSYIFNPVIRKFQGELFVHYPGNFLVLPKFFSYAQIAIYVLVGILLSAVTINMVKNIRAGLPVRTKAMIKNALGRYFAFVAYGVLITALMLFVRESGTVAFVKFAKLMARFLPEPVVKVFPVILPIFIFAANIIMYTFLILTVPVLVIKKSPLLKALAESVRLGLRNFFTIFRMILVPFLFSLPVVLLSSFSVTVARKSCPEAIALIILLRIIVSVSVECFIIICASQFLLDKEKDAIKAQPC